MAAPDQAGRLYLLRGIAEGQLHAFDAAETDLARAQQEMAGDPQAQYGIRVNQGFIRLQQAQLVARQPWPWLDTQAPNWAFAACGAWYAQKLQSAMHVLLEAERMQPHHHAAYRYLALVAQEKHQWEQATQWLGKAIDTAGTQKDSVHAQLYGQRGRVWRAQKEWKKALDDLKWAVKLQPSNAEDHAERGRILHGLKQYQDAVDAYDEALKLRPDWAIVYRWKADALLALEEDEDAALALSEYLKHGGRPSAELYRTLGALHGQLRSVHTSLAAYTEALQLEQDASTYVARAWVYLAGQSEKFALDDFEEAIRRDPRHAEAHAGRALIHARKNRYADAVSDARKALSLDETPRLLWNVSHVYAVLAVRADAVPTTVKVRLGLTWANCVDEANGLLNKALAKTPEKERDDFWMRYIENDPLLIPLRGTPGFETLKQKYKIKGPRK
jgi:tetratricopeptide (TPR) repeat protein